MNNQGWANFYTQQHSEINGYGVWHYLIDTGIGQFHIIEYESKGHEINRQIIDNDNDKAEKAYNRAIKRIMKGW